MIKTMACFCEESSDDVDTFPNVLLVCMRACRDHGMHPTRPLQHQKKLLIVQSNESLSHPTHLVSVHGQLAPRAS